MERRIDGSIWTIPQYNKTRKPDAEMVEAQKIDKIFFQSQEFTVRPLYFLRICKFIGICKFQNPHKFRNGKSHHNPFGTMDRRIDSSIWNIPQSHIMQRQEHALWDTGSSAITLEDSSKAGHHCETNVLPSNSQDMQVSKSPQASKWQKATITLLMMLRTAGQISYYTHLKLPTISHHTRETNVPWDKW